ncbi:MAG: TetR/AcrR family transcriptional regulator [Chloroflexota bacterium]
MSEKLDPRVIRTRRLLRTALLTLIPRKGYASITIQDITDEATLNRSTFYMHYTDKADLFASVIEDVLDELRTITPPPQKQLETARIHRIYERLFEHVQRHWGFYALMLSEDSIASFASQMRQHIEHIAVQLVEPYADDMGAIDPALYASFVSSSFLGVIRWWLRTQPHPPPTEVATHFMQLTLGGMVKAFGLDAEALFGEQK